MNNVNVEIAETTEIIMANEGEYQNNEIDENTPRFIQLAKETQDKDAVIEYIKTAIMEDKEERNNIYHYLINIEKPIKKLFDAERNEYGEATDETYKKLTTIENVIVLIENLIMGEIEKYKQDFSGLPLEADIYDWYIAESLDDYDCITKALNVCLKPPHTYPAYIGYCASNGTAHTLDESLHSITRYLWNFDINVFYEEPLQKTEHQLYEEYKFRWLAKHGYTLTDAISSAMKYAERIGFVGTIDEIISKWEEVGFDGEIYDSFEEWLECEFEYCYQPFFRARYGK